MSAQPTRQVAANCHGYESRGAFLAVLKDAQPAAVRHLCGDASLVKALAEWLADLLADRGGASEHVLLALLQQLGRLPLRPLMLKASGLEELVRGRAAEHRSKEARRLAAAALAAWAPAAAGGGAGGGGGAAARARRPGGLSAILGAVGGAPARPGSAGASGGAAAGGGGTPARGAAAYTAPAAPGAANGGAAKPAAAAAAAPQPAKPQPQPAAEAGSDAAAPAGDAGNADAHAPPAADAGVDIAELDPERAEALRALEAERRRAAETAARAAAEAEALAAQIASEAPLPAIGAHKAPKSKHQRGGAGAGAGAAAARGGASGSGAAAAPGGGASGGGGDAEQRARAELKAFVQELLKAHFKARAVSEDDCRAILKRAVDKVMAGEAERLAAGGGAGGAGGGAFMNDKRRGKVRALVEQYVAQCRRPANR